MIDCDFSDDAGSGDDNSGSGAARLASIAVTITTGNPLLGYAAGKLASILSKL